MKAEYSLANIFKCKLQFWMSSKTFPRQKWEVHSTPVNCVASCGGSRSGLIGVWTSHPARKGATKVLHHCSVFPAYTYWKTHFISTLYCPSDLISHLCRLRLCLYRWCISIHISHHLFLDIPQGGAWCSHYWTTFHPLSIFP